MYSPYLVILSVSIYICQSVPHFVSQQHKSQYMSTHSFKSCPVSLHHYQPTSISPSLFSLFTTTTYNIPQNISKSNMFSLYCLTYFPTQLDSAIDLCSSSWLPISLFHPQQHQKLRDSFQSTLVDSL